jgi:hypothetical protein
MFQTRVLGVMVAVFITLGIAVTGAMLLSQQAANAFRAEDGSRLTSLIQAAPIAISGKNIYITWWTNHTAKGDGEVMYRASNDGGATFGDKINLSNNSKFNSVDAQIQANNDNIVVVTWWEKNKTTNEPVVRISTDKGKTFGPVMRLSTNGTIDSSTSSTIGGT